MRDYGCREEARFTHMFREWYEAADEPGLGPLERNIRCLRLLNGVDFNRFSAPGAHVKGISVVLFEGLLTSIDRHIQLHGFVRGNCYNVRAIGTLDIEQFFDEFTELDPTERE